MHLLCPLLHWTRANVAVQDSGWSRFGLNAETVDVKVTANSVDDKVGPAEVGEDGKAKVGSQVQNLQLSRERSAIDWHS